MLFLPHLVSLFSTKETPHQRREREEKEKQRSKTSVSRFLARGPKTPRRREEKSTHPGEREVPMTARRVDDDEIDIRKAKQNSIRTLNEDEIMRIALAESVKWAPEKSSPLEPPTIEIHPATYQGDNAKCGLYALSAAAQFIKKTYEVKSCTKQNIDKEDLMTEAQKVDWGGTPVLFMGSLGFLKTKKSDVTWDREIDYRMEYISIWNGYVNYPYRDDHKSTIRSVKRLLTLDLDKSIIVLANTASFRVTGADSRQPYTIDGGHWFAMVLTKGKAVIIQDSINIPLNIHTKAAIFFDAIMKGKIKNFEQFKRVSEQIRMMMPPSMLLKPSISSWKRALQVYKTEERKLEVESRDPDFNTTTPDFFQIIHGVRKPY